MPPTPEKPLFDIDAALNEASFTSFVAEHPESESFDMGDTEKVQELYETFQAYKSAKEGTKTILDEVFSEETGLNLDPEELVAVDKALRKKAIENPEALKDLGDALEQKKNSEEAIKVAEEQLKIEISRAKAEVDALQVESGKIELGRKHMTFFGKARHLLEGIRGVFTDNESKLEAYSQRQRQMEELKLKYGNEITSKSLVAELVKLEEKINASNAASAEAKNLLETTKKDLEGKAALAKLSIINSVSDSSEVHEAMKSSIRKSITEALKIGKIEKLDKVEDIMNKIGKEGALLGKQFFTEQELAKHREEIYKSVEGLAEKTIAEAVKSVRLGNNGLADIEKKIAAFAERDNIGNKGEGKKFVIDVLIAESAKLPVTSESREKKILINRLIAKLSK